MNLERTWTTGPANVFGFWARALNPSPAFWLAMFVASAFGTVLGDFWAEGLHLGLVLSFGTLVVITGLLIWGDCLKGQGTEAFYWLAIIFLRAGDQCRRWARPHLWAQPWRSEPSDGRGNTGSWFLYPPAFREGDLTAYRSALLACNGPRRRLWHRLRRSYLAYDRDVPGPGHPRHRSYHRNPCQRRARPDFDARLLVHRPRRTRGRHAGRRLVRIATGARVGPPGRASMRRRGTNSSLVALSSNQEARLRLTISF
jgi:hypothetical protein